MVTAFLCSFLAVAVITVGPQARALPANNALDAKLSEAVCQSPACKDLTNVILSNADFSLDPCVDFHAFTCRNSEMSLDESATNRIERKVSKILKSKQPDAGPNLSKLRAFYTSCLKRGEFALCADSATQSNPTY